MNVTLGGGVTASDRRVSDRRTDGDKWRRWVRWSIAGAEKRTLAPYAFPDRADTYTPHRVGIVLGSADGEHWTHRPRELTLSTTRTGGRYVKEYVYLNFRRKPPWPPQPYPVWLAELVAMEEGRL